MTGTQRSTPVGAGVVMVGLVIFLSVPAWAQDIAGVVKDTSDAVLPGVTVEAASPALIEKVRAVVTDASGQYKIVDLRPGTYSVTFTLPGFRTVRREGIALTTGFTATVNAELQVGALEETITVTGASPIVDVQNVRSQSVLSHEYLETVPTGKAAAGFASLILGVTAAAGADVGGARGERTNNLTIHGSRVQDYKLLVDGMRYCYMHNECGGSQRGFFLNQLGIQEMVLETSGASAEIETGGIQQNAVPKDGGNLFALTALGIFTTPSLTADNLTDALRARGLRSTNSVKRIYDTGVGLGGPLKQDRLWFYTAHRKNSAQQYFAGAYFNKTPGTVFYTPDLSRPAWDDTNAQDHSVRLTWQAAPKHKVTLSQNYQRNCQCYEGLSGTVTPEATNHTVFEPVTLTQATWSHPANNRLLFQVGVTHGFTHYFRNPIEGVTADAIAITDLATGYRYGARAGLQGSDGNADLPLHQLNIRASGAYVTGSHAFKAGLMMHQGSDDDVYYVNQAISYTVRTPAPGAAPVPVSVTQWASPRKHSAFARNLGLYAQDQWTLRRLTLNLGVRLDYLRTTIPAQTRPAGRFVPEFSFPKVDNVPNWKDVNPRLGAAYDLFGNGKTALKASFGGYVVAEGTRIVLDTSPSLALVQSATRVWNDVNGDYIPQESELGPLSNAAFGTVRQNRFYDEKLLRGWGIRPFNRQASAGFQQELRPGLGLSIGYFHTAYGNIRVTDNVNVTPADYSPYCVTAPVDARLPGGGGNQICGLSDITPTAFGSVRNFITSASDFGTQTEVFNGVEIGLSWRFGQGGVLNGGVSTGRTTTNICFVVDSPQQLYQCEVTAPDTQVKVNGAYPLPWGLQVSGVYQNLQGTPILANLLYTNAQIAPSLGRNLGSCGIRVPCNGTATVSLIEPGTLFEDRYTQLDLRLARTFRMGRARLQAILDAYNVFNASAIISRNNAYGPLWGRPTQIELGRLFKLGTQFDW